MIRDVFARIFLLSNHLPFYENALLGFKHCFSVIIRLNDNSACDTTEILQIVYYIYYFHAWYSHWKRLTERKSQFYTNHNLYSRYKTLLFCIYSCLDSFIIKKKKRKNSTKNSMYPSHQYLPRGQIRLDMTTGGDAQCLWCKRIPWTSRKQTHQRDNVLSLFCVLRFPPPFWSATGCVHRCSPGSDRNKKNDGTSAPGSSRPVKTSRLFLLFFFFLFFQGLCVDRDMKAEPSLRDCRVTLWNSTGLGGHIQNLPEISPEYVVCKRQREKERWEDSWFLTTRRIDTRAHTHVTS